jgi:Mrp family chromosome partitioning ATPase
MGFTSARLSRRALKLLYSRQVAVLGLVLNFAERGYSEYDYYRYQEYYEKART